MANKSAKQLVVYETPTLTTHTYFSCLAGQYREANDKLHQVLGFIKEAHADDLQGYHGNNVGHILELLHGVDYNSSAGDGGDYYGSGAGSGGGSGLGGVERDRRALVSLSDLLSLHLSPRLHDALLHRDAGGAVRSSSSRGGRSSRQAETTSSNNSDGDSRANRGSAEMLTADIEGSGGGAQGAQTPNSYLQTAMRLLKENIQLKSEIAKLYSGIKSAVLLDSGDSDEFDKDDLMVYRNLGSNEMNRARRDTPGPVPGQQAGEAGNRHVVHRHNHNLNRTRGSHHVNNKDGGGERFNSYASGGGESRENDFMYTGVVQKTDYNNDHNRNGDYDDQTHHKTVRSKSGGRGHRPRYINGTHHYIEEHGDTHAEKLKEIAHILHFCSIGILGIFVAQLFLKLFGMGITEFFKKKMEIFDAVIILASFALDLVFLEGVGGAQGEEAAALLIVFLLWRILRVINGIMVTAKKRQEFRIKLQKRARRRGDKKVELLEEDKSLKEKEIAALRELCARRGADEDEIKACKPRRKSKSIMPRMDTSMGLTSVASLSLSLSMSMSGGAFNSIARSNPILNRRDSIQDVLPPQRNPRRSSLMYSKPIEILQNHFRGGDNKSPRGSGSLFSNKRLSMEKVVEEKEVDNGGEELINKRNTVGDAIQEGSGEANLALLDHHGLAEVQAQPILNRKPPAVTFDVENEIDEKIVPLAFDRGSLGLPSPSRSEHSQSNSSMANGPVRRASSSSRASNKENDDVTVTIGTQPVPGDVKTNQGDVITHHSQMPTPNDAAVAVNTVNNNKAVQASACDASGATASPLRADLTAHGNVSPHHADVASHLNEVTMHLDDVNTHLDDVATHLTDVTTIQRNDDDELSSSSDSEESRHMLPSKGTGRLKGHETTRL